MLIPRPWLIPALAAAFAVSNGVSFYRGWHTGATLAEARHTTELAQAQAVAFRAAEAASRAETERLAAQAAADRLARELEDEARRDPNAGQPALGLDSVRRLARR